MRNKFFSRTLLVMSFLICLFSFKTANGLTLTRIPTPTLTIIDHTKPVILSVNISNITTSSARINWETDENSSSTVVLSGGGLSGKVFTNASQSSVTQHSVDLTGLNTHTLYSFTVKSKDGFGNEITSSSSNFSTLNTPLTISNVSVTGISSTGARIKWITNRKSTSRVMYYINNTNNGTTVKNDNAVTQHDFSLNELDPDTEYIFRAESADSDLVQAYSSWRVFRTLSSATTADDESQDNSSSLDSTADAGSETEDQVSSQTNPVSSDGTADTSGGTGDEAATGNSTATNVNTSKPSSDSQTNPNSEAAKAGFTGWLSNFFSTDSTSMFKIGFFIESALFILAAIIILLVILKKRHPKTQVETLPADQKRNKVGAKTEKNPPADKK